MVSAVLPTLVTVQVMVAAVGVVGVVLLHPLSATTAPVVLTIRLTGVLGAVPAGVGVAVSVPLYTPAVVALVTVTVPQGPMAQEMGPVTVAPVMLL